MTIKMYKSNSIAFSQALGIYCPYVCGKHLWRQSKMANKRFAGFYQGRKLLNDVL